MVDRVSGVAPSPAASLVGPLRSLAQLYLAVMRTMLLRTMQYRVANLVEMSLMLAEPVVYLIVWRLVAREQGGEVGGYSEGRFAAYFIAWSLVRVATQIGSPQNWEDHVREGRMSAMLLRPIHPVHQDVALWLGFAVARALLWLPAGVALTIAFRPTVSTGPLQVAVFVVSLALANVMRSLAATVTGLSAFWLTRVAGVSNLQSLLDLTLSGRLVPPDLMPRWLEAISWALPFRWMFAFPIESLIGPTTPARLATGLAVQIGWLLVIVAVLRLIWRRGVVRYGAVGG